MEQREDDRIKILIYQFYREVIKKDMKEMIEFSMLECFKKNELSCKTSLLNEYKIELENKFLKHKNECSENTKNTVVEKASIVTVVGLVAREIYEYINRVVLCLKNTFFKHCYKFFNCK